MHLSQEQFTESCSLEMQTLSIQGKECQTKVLGGGKKAASQGGFREARGAALSKSPNPQEEMSQTRE